MPWLLLGFLLLIGGLFVLRWLATAEPSKLARQIQVGGSILLIAAAAGLALTGRFGMAVPLVIAAVGFIAPKRFRGSHSSDNPGASTGRRTPPQRGGMSRAEALEVLGLKPGASDSDIREAHRRLIVRIHPDQGGSDYLAARINEAKDVLLGRGMS